MLSKEVLEKPYIIKGTVIKGNQIGRLLGYPTANIDYSNYFLPKNGVYLVEVLYKNNKYIGMANIGFNPTVNLQNNRRFEVHIIDFSKEIYGEELEVKFIKFLRDETKYNSKEELINSLEETVKICRNYYSMIE